jgi:fimbrial chaperone protein
VRRRIAGVAALLLAYAASAPAGNLTVAPTRIDLAGPRSTGSVTLENNAAEPVLVQVETFAWQRGPATSDLEPTGDLVAVPPVFQLEPGAKQVIRVALREPGERQVEGTYRLLISEVPGAEGVKGGGVRFALRLNLPVFATPSGAAPRPHWLLRKNGKGGALELVNAGTAHIQLRRLRLRGEDGKAETIEGPGYVLAGQRDAWNVKLPVKPGATFILEADTNLGQLEVPLTAREG